MVARGAGRGGLGRSLRRMGGVSGSAHDDIGAIEKEIASEGKQWRKAYEAAGGDGDPSAKHIAELVMQKRQRRQEAEAQASNIADAAIGGMVMQAVNNIVTSPMRQMDRASMLMGNNFRGAAMSMVGEVPLIGGYAQQLIDSMGKLTDAIVQRGEALSPYSGELATATSMASVRQLMADLEEARKNGSSYARVIDQQSKLQTELQAVFNPIKEQIALIVGDGLGMVREFIEYIRPILETYRAELMAIRMGIKTQVEVAKLAFSLQDLMYKGVMSFLEEEKKKDADMTLQKIWDSVDLADTMNDRIPEGRLPPDLGAMGFGILDIGVKAT